MPFLLMSLIQRIRNDINGARILADWVGSGAEPVSHELAQARANVCATCPLNQRGRELEAGIANVILEQERIRTQIGTKLPNEAKLKSCSACGCYLRLKVWVPMERLRPYSKLQDFPSHCWMRTENVRQPMSNKPVTQAAPSCINIPVPGSRKTGFDVTVDRQSALGDAILASAVGTMIASHGYSVGMMTAPGLREVFDHHPHVTITEKRSGALVDLNGVWERLENRKSANRRDEYLNAAREQLAKQGINLPESPLPPAVLRVTDTELSEPTIEMLTMPRPLVAISPGSQSWPSRDIPDSVWISVMAGIKGTPVWVGKRSAPPGVFDPKIRTLRRLMAFIGSCDYMISADTGPLHVALALGVPSTVIEGPFKASLMLHADSPWISVHSSIPCIGCGEFSCPLPTRPIPCTTPSPKAILRQVSRCGLASFPLQPARNAGDDERNVGIEPFLFTDVASARGRRQCSRCESDRWHGQLIR